MNYFAPLYLPPFEEEGRGEKSLIDTVSPSAQRGRAVSFSGEPRIK